ncbi:MAG: biopolymer transporter ExbD [Candidatus Accumulibacter sp.]|jgi:biopolymer transport protein ExbD|nr:biopolymer transporter ExbD [Accumulibacter sp.]
MRNRRGGHYDDPEINLIPFIDVLLVIIIFLMMTTTYSKFSALEINLPTASDTQQVERRDEINVALTADGRVLINQTPLASADVQSISDMLRRAAGDTKDPLIIINADAKATHQSVVDIMHASQMAGYPHISFATRTAP